ncbi:MAG: hypothetical protein B6241_01695 [Spirochaetaceae bacterium 4572_59]|nr:MAG: hypothetical protein B6241_01695 [Spirochaetaceae bacterium 4572_59]
MLQELCILKGFSKEIADSAMSSLSEISGEETKTSFAPMTDSMQNRKVEDVLEDLFKGIPGEGKALTEGKRVVFMAVHSKERAVAIMRSVKSVSVNPHEIIFAMVTETALKWTVGHYIDHLAEEHEYMKTHNPAQDPDMKKV